MLHSTTQDRNLICSLRNIDINCNSVMHVSTRREHITKYLPENISHEIVQGMRDPPTQYKQTALQNYKMNLQLLTKSETGQPQTSYDISNEIFIY